MFHLVKKEGKAAPVRRNGREKWKLDIHPEWGSGTDDTFGCGGNLFVTSERNSLNLRPCAVMAIQVINQWETTVVFTWPSRVRYKTGEELCLKTFVTKSQSENATDNLQVSIPISVNRGRTAYYFTTAGKFDCKIHRDPLDMLPKKDAPMKKDLTNLNKECARLFAIRNQVRTIMKTGTYLAKMAHQCENPSLVEGDRRNHSYHYCRTFMKPRMEQYNAAFGTQNFHISDPINKKDATDESIAFTKSSFVDMYNIIDDVIYLTEELADRKSIPTGCEVWRSVREFSPNDKAYSRILTTNGIWGYTRYILIVPLCLLLEDTLLRDYRGRMFVCDAMVLCCNAAGLWSLLFVSLGKTAVGATQQQITEYRILVEALYTARNIVFEAYSSDLRAFRAKLRKTYDLDKLPNLGGEEEDKKKKSQEIQHAIEILSERKSQTDPDVSKSSADYDSPVSSGTRAIPLVGGP